MGELPKTLEIIFQVQMKKINEEMTRRKISFSTYKMLFFLFFLSFQTPSTFKLHNFLIFYSFKTI